MPPKKGSKQRRGIERRQAILDAAVDLMSTNGFRGTGLSALADRVGLTEPGVLHHFGSKEELLLAVLEERDRRNDPLVQQIAKVGGLDATRSLPAIGRALADRPGLVRLSLVLQVEHLSDDGPAHDFFVRRTADGRKLVGEALRRGIDRGEFRTDLDVEQKAAEIVAFMDGIALQWLLEPTQVDLVAAYASYSQALERDLTAGLQ